jgi:hypothetical protein
MLGGIGFAYIFPYVFPQVMEVFFTEITHMNLSELTSAEIRFHNLLSGVIGGIMFGWGLMLAFLGYRLVKRPVAWIWTVIAISLIAWYLSDTLASIMAGSSFNVALNTTLFLLAMPPVLVNRKSVRDGWKMLSEN